MFEMQLWGSFRLRAGKLRAAFTGGRRQDTQDLSMTGCEVFVRCSETASLLGYRRDAVPASCTGYPSTQATLNGAARQHKDESGGVWWPESAAAGLELTAVPLLEGLGRHSHASFECCAVFISLAGCKAVEESPVVACSGIIQCPYAHIGDAEVQTGQGVKDVRRAIEVSRQANPPDSGHTVSNEHCFERKLCRHCDLFRFGRARY